MASRIVVFPLSFMSIRTNAAPRRCLSRSPADMVAPTEIARRSSMHTHDFAVEVGGVTSEEQDRNKFYRSTFERILGQLVYGATLQTHVVDRLSSSDKADQRSLRTVLLDMSRLVTKTIFEGWDRIFGQA